MCNCFILLYTTNLFLSRIYPLFLSLPYQLSSASSSTQFLLFIATFTLSPRYISLFRGNIFDSRASPISLMFFLSVASFIPSDLLSSSLFRSRFSLLPLLFSYSPFHPLLFDFSRFPRFIRLFLLFSFHMLPAVVYFLLFPSSCFVRLVKVFVLFSTLFFYHCSLSFPFAAVLFFLPVLPFLRFFLFVLPASASFTVLPCFLSYLFFIRYIFSRYYIVFSTFSILPCPLLIVSEFTCLTVLFYQALLIFLSLRVLSRTIVPFFLSPLFPFHASPLISLHASF